MDAMKETGGKQEKSNTRKIVNGLLNYSVAAAATVAMAQPLQAAVVQSGLQNVTLSPGDCHYIDLNGDMIDDFEICLYSDPGYTYGILFGGIDNAAMIYPHKYASRLCSEEVPGDTDWSLFLAYTHVDYDGDRYGNFWGKNGSIGVRFEIPEGGQPQNEETHYGYIRIAVSPKGDRIGITDWAYESVPGESILTPPCGSPSAADPTTVPTLNQWGMLFFMGLILLEGGRRLKKESGKKA